MNLIKRAKWTKETDNTLIIAIKDCGKNWDKVMRMYLPNFSDVSIKNRYYYLMKKGDIIAEKRQY